MKYIKHKSAMTKAILVAGSSMLIAIYASGCNQDDHQQRQAMGEYFPAKGEVRDITRIERVQAASGTHFDATLQPYHFDKGDLNSLGREKLALMLDDDDANNPITIYLNVPTDDEFKAGRQDAIIAFLKDQGLEEKQISFKEGPNPGTATPASEGLARLDKTESGPVSSSAGSSPAPGGTDSPMAGGGGGITSK